MSISYSEEVSLTCPDCQETFQAEVWVVVDLQERPDLAERCRAGTIHVLSCPNCSFEGSVDAPLLIYDANADRLFFVPPEQTTAERDRRLLTGLLTILHEALGDSWHNELVEEMGIVSWEELPFALSSASLLQLLSDFIQADSWSASERIVGEHPELLSKEAENLMEQLITGARNSGNEEAVSILIEHQELLRRCREVGVEWAFAEKAGLPPELRHTLANLSEEEFAILEAVATLPPNMQEDLLKLLSISSPEELERALKEHPELEEVLERILSSTKKP